GVTPIPKSGEARDLNQRNHFAHALAMTLAPAANIVGRVKWQYERAVLVDVIPGARRRHGKVNEDVLYIFRHAIVHLDHQSFPLRAEASVDTDPTTREGGDAESAPDAGRPPRSALALDPVQRWRERERMDDPRFTDVRMEDHAVDRRKI